MDSNDVGGSLNDASGTDAWLRLYAKWYASARIEEDVRGSMRVFSVDGVRMTRVWIAPHVLEHDQLQVERQSASHYVLCVQVSGEGSIVVQDGRSAHLRSGDISLYDTSRPYTLVHDEPVECVGIVIPRHAMPVPGRVMRELTARRFDGNDAVAGFVHALSQVTENSLSVLPEFARHRAVHGFLGQVQTLFTHEAALAGFTSDPRRARFEAVLADVEERLADDDLGPEQLAMANHMSVRALHALAQEHGIAIAAWIRRRRLEQCRDDLVNPALAHLNVAQIGARWGLSNAAHFSTLFRAEFGIAPSEFRRQHETVAQ